MRDYSDTVDSTAVEVERRGKVADIRAHARQRLERETQRNEFDD